MQNFIREEGVFITGVVLLTLLIVGTSYAQQGDKKEVTSSADIVHVTVSAPAPVIQPAATVTTPVTKGQVTSPRVRVKEQEYDE